ncbi:MAG: peptide chain release factor N(5)-glutamine methyltransferase [Patescibacteria group bacterium]
MDIKGCMAYAIKIIENIDAEILLQHTIKKNKTYIHTHPEFKLNKQQEKKYKKYIFLRKTGLPAAYIVGHKEFYGLNFLVNKKVLIPRPETELLVEEALLKLKTKITKHRKKINIIDMGTGSGCIIISIAKNIIDKNIKFYATDISKKALAVAQKNVKLNNIYNKIKFIKSDLLKNINSKLYLQNSILIANLPYLPDNFNKKNLKYEPACALYAGKDGLYLYYRLFSEIKKSKYKPEYILLEFGCNQARELKKIIKNNLPEYIIKIKKDLAGLNRVIILKNAKLNKI